MIGSIGAQVALLAFAVALFAGLYAGNTPTTVLARALLAMVAGLLVGQWVAWVCKQILREHLQQRKVQIDLGHVDALEPGSAEDAASAQGTK